MKAKDYLSANYKEKTAQTYYVEWLDFIAYLETLGRSPENTDYDLVLDYIGSLQKRNLNPRSINRKLMIIEKVFMGIKVVEPNPVQGLRLKNAQDKPLPEPLNYERLSQYLSAFPTETAIQYRNKIILSLIHHQALRASEIIKLTISDLQLKRAQIEIPSVTRSNYRILDLTALQLIDLQHYLLEIRPQFTTENDLLFPAQGAKSLQNSLMCLKKRLQRALPTLQNLEHWRSSVIVHWLENQSVLEVQKKLGHRYPSSTEKYKIHRIKSLQEELSVHHPLR